MSLEKWLKAAVAVVGAIAISGPSFARDPAAVAREATNEVASELAECAAFYAIAAAGMEATIAPDQERYNVVASLKKSAETAIGVSVKLTDPKIAAERINLARQTITRQMQSTWENLSIIVARYKEPCKDRVEAPDKRFAYWFKEKDKLPDLPPAK